MAKTFLLSNGITTKIRRHKGAKKLSLLVKSRGIVSLTIPFYVSFRHGKEFLESKADWILEKINLCKKTTPHFLREGNREEYLLYKEKARACVLERLAYFQTQYPYQFKRVSIRHSETRWGSCSRQGNLNFSYRIYFLSPRLRDYIIVHELCHLKELNHSSAFWTLVAETFPDYKKMRRELNSFTQAKKQS